MVANLSWKSIYKEFGIKLINYKSDRDSLITKIKKVFSDINMKLPKLEKDNAIKDIDPFTVFALFNKKIKDENRIAILNGFKNEFSLSSDIPSGFDSLPTMMPLSATFYWFEGDRGIDDIQHLWDLYVAAYAYIQNRNEVNKQEFCRCFDIAKKQNGISWRITSGLYWAMPDNFFSLDSINRWYIREYGDEFSNELKNTFIELMDVPNGEKYLSICEQIKNEISGSNFCYHDFANLSHNAFINAENVNKENKEKEKKSQEIEIEDNSTHYWIYSPGVNAVLWDECKNDGVMLLGWGEVGDASKFKDKNEIKKKMKEVYNSDRSFKNDAHAVWQFTNELKPGDIIYAKKGMHKIIGRGVVESEYIYNEKSSNQYKHLRKIKWTNVGSWNHPDGQAAMKTLTDITQYTDYVQKLESLFYEDEADEPIIEKESKNTSYNKNDFLNNVYMDSDEYDRLAGLLIHEKNIILQGAPGVGKTYIARKLAYSIIGEVDTERVEMVQFHQSYSYEDFVIGYRPGDNQSFELCEGIFYKFCKKAEEDDENNPYFFIIDEINRGNMSKIFGELFMLIENDKRGIEIPLLYGKRKFKIPKNINIIGTMNTADRSLAIIDYALRRRFAFYNISPKFDNDKFIEYVNSFENEKFVNLINTVKSLNVAISKDETLGEGFCIGHSYFSNLQSVDDITLYNIIEYKIIQLIKEYWFDETTKLETWSDALRKSIQ